MLTFFILINNLLFYRNNVFFNCEIFYLIRLNKKSHQIFDGF